jgi:outer membrane beta-barrel protein
MRTTTAAIGSCLLVLALALPALAQEGGEEGGAAPAKGEEGGEAAPKEQPQPTVTDDQLKTSPSDVAPTTPVLTTGYVGPAARAWKDIVVIPRKPILKSGRVEILPFFGVTINDNLIQHYGLGAEVNYFLTDILALGLEGVYYFKNVLDEEFKTRYDFGRVPSLNQYRFTAAMNFAYVPLYGKFALFNKVILHFEVFAAAGVGVTGTEIIPRDYQYETFGHYAITIPVSGGMRLLVNKWLAVNVRIKDYIMVDKFEPLGRGGWTPCGGNQYTKKDGSCGSEVDAAKSYAESSFVNNVMFTVGVSFFLPPDFKYTTFR